MLFLPINLNTASKEEIMLVPGMSRKMAHEFDEYRPYTSLEQFRREIGKYVNENEVARLERYIEIR
jgi:DNA uptake protein ComE-like DNA-binding protein